MGSVVWATAEVARIMQLPGDVNHAYDPPQPTEWNVTIMMLQATGRMGALDERAK
jgi:hypothetical protein